MCLHTTSPYNLIKENVTEQTSNTEGLLYLACNEQLTFSLLKILKIYLWSFQNECDALHYPLDNICIRFVSRMYKQIVDIPMGINFAPLVADLFVFCYERCFFGLFLTIIKLVLLKHPTLL